MKRARVTTIRESAPSASSSSTSTRVEVYKRRPRRYTRRYRVPRPLSSQVGFPPILHMRHAYHCTLSKQVLPTEPNTVRVNVLNLAHPVQEVVDLREATFKDQVEAVYKNYMVLGAKVEFEVVLQEAIANPVYAIAMQDDDFTSTPYMNTLMSRPGVNWRLLTGDVSDARARVKLVQNYSLRKTFGRDMPTAHLEADSSSYIGPDGGNGNTVRLYLYQPVTVASPSVPALAFVSVHVSWYVKWYNLKDVAPSFYQGPVPPGLLRQTGDVEAPDVEAPREEAPPSQEVVS